MTAERPSVLRRFQDDQPEHLREIGLQETRLEMILKADKLINEEDLISSTRKFGQLGNLYQSLVSRVASFVLSRPRPGPLVPLSS